MNTLNQIKRVYDSKRAEILSRLRGFEQVWSNGDDEEIFTELAFCILTPQSRARVCWEAVLKLRDEGLLFNGNAEKIGQKLFGVRFKNNKAEYIISARKLFTNNKKLCIIPSISRFHDVYECREWLVENVNGIGYKESSHFLRNIGFGEKIAILDRHILKNLDKLNVIEQIPKSIGRAKYIRIEKDMKNFARRIDIPVAQLDLVLWYKETGEIFK